MAKTKRNRAKLAKLRSCIFDGQPWSIRPASMSQMIDAIESRDSSMVEASMSTGEGMESQTQMVGSVAIIPVAGVLRDGIDFMVRYGYATAYQQIEQEFAAALANEQVKSIVFHF